MTRFLHLQDKLDSKCFSVMEEFNNNIFRISLPSLEGLVFIDVRDISYCEADGNYTKIHLINGKIIFVTLLLAECELKLNRFLFFSRIHRSYMANLNCADHYEKGKDGTLFLTDKFKTRLPVSRTHKKEFLEKWG